LALIGGHLFIGANFRPRDFSKLATNSEAPRAGRYERIGAGPRSHPPTRCRRIQRRRPRVCFRATARASSCWEWRSSARDSTSDNSRARTVHAVGSTAETSPDTPAVRRRRQNGPPSVASLRNMVGNSNGNDTRQVSHGATKVPENVPSVPDFPPISPISRLSPISPDFPISKAL
jgi:hypothetical protein